MPIEGNSILDASGNIDVVGSTIKILGSLLPDVGDMVENLISLCQNASIKSLKSPFKLVDDIVGAITLAVCTGILGFLYTKMIAPVCNGITRCKGKLSDFLMSMPIMLCSIRISALIVNVVMLAFEYVYSFTEDDKLRMLLAIAIITVMMLLMVYIVWLIGNSKKWFGAFVNCACRVLLSALMGVVIYWLGVCIVNWSNQWQTLYDLFVIIVAPLVIMYIFTCLRINSLNPFKQA